MLLLSYAIARWIRADMRAIAIGWIRADMRAIAIGWMRALFSLLCPMLLQVDLWLESRKHQNSCFS
jgi:hypothetical protein